MNRTLYTALWIFGLPLVLLRLLWRARLQREYLRHWSERFGFATRRSDAPVIWVHAVSVGETRAAQPLIAQLLARYPRHDLLLTHTTPTGRATGAELFATNPRVRQSYLPYDLPWCVRRFLRGTSPVLGIVMETEIWPNLLHASKRAQLPILLANARLSERSHKGYAGLGRLAQEAVGSFTAIGAQTEQDAMRFRQLAPQAKIVVTGNVKYDVAISEDSLSLATELRAQAGARPIVLFASSRDGEEALFLNTVQRGLAPNTLLLIVPRHPQRFDDVAKLINAHGIRLCRRSKGVAQLSPDAQVWLGDSMGEMPAYFAASDVAIIGGSWMPLGGHNLLEACALGVPVVVGPHTFNFAEAAQLAIAAGAAVRCQNPEEAMSSAYRIINDGAQRTIMSDAGKAFVAQHRGATDKTMQLIAPLISDGFSN